MIPVTRKVARAFIWTPQHEVLLIRVDLPWVPGGVWTLPGGGIEQDETPEQCVAREVFEETGLRNVAIERKLWQCNINFYFRKKARTSLEQHYLILTNKFEPDMGNMLDYELEIMRGFRWWKPDEILNSNDSFSPRQLGKLALSLSTNSFPDHVIDLENPLPLAYRPA